MSKLTQSEKFVKRLEDEQRRAKRPVLVSVMVLLGTQGEPVFWTVRELDKVEGLRLIDLPDDTML